ncbi:kinase-like domain-containing protein [Scheffersomyces amazonensis]|uniref:kinase-like domain-containing protein n=1 Tax=Scheffersomyces amazonensis TaxID=1078765 RepID=UPI00315DE0D0
MPLEAESATNAENHQFKKFLNKLSGQPSSYARKQNYTFGKTLGAGSFGIVRYARDNITDEEVAVKIILKKALKGNEQMVIEELKLLQELNHPHIVGFRDWFESKDKFYIVTQLATGGELFDRIVNKGRFTEHDASLVIVEMLEAIVYLHGKDIVHRDLKPENVLYLNPSEDADIVIADFGIAKRLQTPNEKLTSSAGSFGYAAPEVIIGSGHGKPCDIWSLGVITYTLLCGYSPFRSENVQDFVREVEHNNAVIFHADYWKDVSKDARRFIIKALQFDPNNRPTAQQLLQDPWLVSVAADHKETDLLPKLKQGFDAKAKFRQAIMMVKLNNRIKKLKAIQTELDDDPSEINLFGDSGSLISEVGTSTPTSAHANPLYSWKKLSDVLSNLEAENSKASLSPLKSPYFKDINGKASTKQKLQGDAFIQLVQTASENRERVESYRESGDEADKKTKEATEEKKSNV